MSSPTRCKSLKKLALNENHLSHCSNRDCSVRTNHFKTLVHWLASKFGTTHDHIRIYFFALLLMFAVIFIGTQHLTLTFIFGILSLGMISLSISRIAYTQVKNKEEEAENRALANRSIQGSKCVKLAKKQELPAILAYYQSYHKRELLENLANNGSEDIYGFKNCHETCSMDGHDLDMNDQSKPGTKLARYATIAHKISSQEVRMAKLADCKQGKLSNSDTIENLFEKHLVQSDLNRMVDFEDRTCVARNRHSRDNIKRSNLIVTNEKLPPKNLRAKSFNAVNFKNIAADVTKKTMHLKKCEKKNMTSVLEQNYKTLMVLNPELATIKLSKRNSLEEPKKAPLVSVATGRRYNALINMTKQKPENIKRSTTHKLNIRCGEASQF